VKHHEYRDRQVMLVKVDIPRLAASLSRNGRKYLRVKDVALMLGVSRRTAGKILASMERMGLAVRWSSSVYRLSH